MTCGERIRELRIGKKLSLERLAREAGIPAATLEAWETGAQAPDKGKLLVLAAILGVNAEYLEHGILSPDRDDHRSSGRAGGACLIAAVLIYFAGVGLGLFDRQAFLFGMPLINYGTSLSAVCLLALICGAAVLGICLNIHNRKRK